MFSEGKVINFTFPFSLEKLWQSYVMYTNCNRIFYDWNEKYVFYQKIFNRKFLDKSKVCSSFQGQPLCFVNCFCFLHRLAGKCNYWFLSNIFFYWNGNHLSYEKILGGKYVDPFKANNVLWNIFSYFTYVDRKFFTF